MSSLLLDRYANNYHHWNRHEAAGRVQFYRPLGLVETSFDADGVYFEGRADISAGLDLEISSKLNRTQLEDRILLAWTALRLSHVLLMSKAVDAKDLGFDVDGVTERLFVVQPPDSASLAIREASTDLIFAEDGDVDVAVDEFYRHVQNTARAVDAKKNLAKLFVLPVRSSPGTKADLRFLFVFGHQISDGLTNYTWLSHYVKLLNLPLSKLKEEIGALCSTESISSRLPSAQEDLYPAISGSIARRRWFWTLTIVLRHVKKPQPAAFPNPLRKIQATKPQPMPPKYPRLLDYGKVPPLNTFSCSASLSAPSTRRLHSLCREAKASIGAGCFVLTAMTMMSLYETREPDIPLHERLPFIGSFPINPRPFFNHVSPPDSLMLAFSDGVVLPFLPSDLPFNKRFRLLVKQAHRQLGRYQKRIQPQAPEVDMKSYMGIDGAGRVIALNYLRMYEMLSNKLPASTLAETGIRNPQGSLATRQNPTMATCGVSSVGRSMWRKGEFDIEAELRQGEDAFVADFRASLQNVRAREGEFLVGIGGDDEGVGANVSFDACAIDPDMVLEWKRKIEGMMLSGSEPARL